VYRVGIISDTHGAVPNDIYAKFHRVDCILHAGDLGSSTVLLDLEVIAPVYAVHGNLDFFDFSHQLPRERIVTVGSLSFALIHGDQCRRSHIITDLIDRFRDANVDIVVFGHTHHYYVMRHGNLWLVNPGSANSGTSSSGILATFDDQASLNWQKIEFSNLKNEENTHDHYHDAND